MLINRQLQSNTNLYLKLKKNFLHLNNFSMKTDIV